MIDHHPCPLCDAPFWRLNLGRKVLMLQSCQHNRSVMLSLCKIERTKRHLPLATRIVRWLHEHA